MSSGGKSLTGYLCLVVIPVLITVSLGSWQWLEHSDALTFDRYHRDEDRPGGLVCDAQDGR